MIREDHCPAHAVIEQSIATGMMWMTKSYYTNKLATSYH